MTKSYICSNYMPSSANYSYQLSQGISEERSQRACIGSARLFRLFSTRYKYLGTIVWSWASYLSISTSHISEFRGTSHMTSDLWDRASSAFFFGGGIRQWVLIGIRQGSYNAGPKWVVWGWSTLVWIGCDSMRTTSLARVPSQIGN